MAVDITINETIDLVDITVNPNIIEVNVTRTSGGGGSQTLAQTLDLGNTTGGENILINDADAIELENTSLLKKGTYDFGGDGGISRICSVDYEDMWQAGIRHVFDNNGLIRHSTNCFDIIPNFGFDVTLRFKVDSLWTLDNGTTYKCTDAAQGAAVWEIYNFGATPTLQQVTDEGATTDNTIYVSDGAGNEISIQIGQVQILDAFGNVAQIGAQGAGFVNGDGTGIDQCSVSLAAAWSTQQTGLFLSTQDGTGTAVLEIKLPTEYYTDLPVENIASNYFIPFKPSGDYTLATLDDITGGGTVTSVDLSMPSAFTVTNNPVTTSGTLTVTGAGAVSQYVRGDGSLANFPTSSGGGSSLSFYLNGSVSQGTFGGVAFKEMDRTPILGAGTDFTINANGYIQSFITDAGVPNLLEIPAGNWNFETYFSASSGGGSPSFYVELYKWNGTTLSLIASNSATPENITGGTSIDLYVSALAVPQTTLLATDRLAVRIYVTHSGRTITLHTEDNHLCQVITTFSTGLTALNGLTAQVQNFATGTTGTDFAISSTTSTHTFNLPTASAANRGALSSADWITFNDKQNTSTLLVDSFDKAILRNNYFYFTPSTITLGQAASFGFSERLTGSTFVNLLNGNLLKGMVTFATTAIAGTIASMRRNDALQLQGYECKFTRKIQFQSNVSGQRFFCGISKGNQFTAVTNVEPNTLTDIVGVCQLSTSTNMHIIYNDAAGTATTVDLGSNYPCNDSQYNYYISVEQTTTSYIITVERVTVATGASISTSTTTATNIPNYATGVIQLLTFITNNATAAIASYLDGGCIGSFKN